MKKQLIVLNALFVAFTTQCGFLDDMKAKAVALVNKAKVSATEQANILKDKAMAAATEQFNKAKEAAIVQANELKDMAIAAATEQGKALVDQAKVLATEAATGAVDSGKAALMKKLGVAGTPAQ
jgi:hypothetical protein